MCFQPTSDDLLQSSRELECLLQEVELLRAEVATASMLSGRATCSSGNGSTVGSVPTSLAASDQAPPHSGGGDCAPPHLGGGDQAPPHSGGGDCAPTSSMEEMGQPDVAVGVLIDLVTSDDTQSLPTAGHQLSRQQPDLLGDCIVLSEQPSSDTDLSPANSEPSQTAPSPMNHSAISQELF